MDNSENLVIEFGNKLYSLKIQDFDTDIDVEAILNIDYANLLGEILTFPVLFNRIGNLRAEYEALVKTAALDLEVLKAETKARIRKAETSMVDDGKGKTKIVGPTVDELESRVLQDSAFKIAKRNLINLEKNYSKIESIYWSAKSKDGKLDRLSDKMKPEEFSMEILQDTCNGVAIRKVKNNMQEPFKK